MTECSQVTEFVIDAQKEYILINRHVICVSSFSEYCVFKNHEKICIKLVLNTCEHVNFECDTNICTTKCEVHSVYHDSVHDFDYLKFDLMTIKYMRITELKLKFEFIHVSVKIQVVSNDAEEKLSIFLRIIN